MRKMNVKEYLSLPGLEEICNINIEKAELMIEGKSTKDVDEKYKQFFTSKVFYRKGDTKGQINTISFDDNEKIIWAHEDVELIEGE